MKSTNESIEQRISAFMNRKARQFPDIDLLRAESR